MDTKISKVLTETLASFGPVIVSDQVLAFKLKLQSPNSTELLFQVVHDLVADHPHPADHHRQPGR